MPRVQAARASDIPEGTAKAIDVGGVTVALFHRPEGWFAIANTCTHRGGPLADGDVEGTVVTCPWHGAQYDIRTGALMGPPAPRGVQAFRVVVEGDIVTIET